MAGRTHTQLSKSSLKISLQVATEHKEALKATQALPRNMQKPVKFPIFMLAWCLLQLFLLGCAAHTC